MAQYAAQDGGTRSQSTPFGYDATWLAQQQQGQMPYGFSDNFSFTGPQQQHPPHGSASAGGGSILNQTDNSLLGTFFSNPDITNQMDFNFDTTMPEGGGGGEDNKATTGEALFDLDGQSGTIHDPATALAPQRFGYGGEYQTQTHIDNNSQQPSMDGQMTGAHGNREQSGEEEEDEEEETKAVAQGLMGMSTNRPNPAHMMLGNGTGFGARWGDMINSPLMNAAAMHIPQLAERQSTGPGGGQIMMSQVGQPQGQAHIGSFGHLTSSIPSQFHMPGYPSSMHMHQQQAYANQIRSRHQSAGNIRTAGFTHLPQDAPRSALLPSAAYPNFDHIYDNHPQVNLRMPRYGSDDNFSSTSYRPPSGYNPEDEKSTNLTGVPGASEASANAQFRQSPMMPPHARTTQAGGQNHPTAGRSSSNSQPSTPTYYNNQHYLGGLPGATISTMTMGTSSYGGSGMGSLPSHAHPAPHPNYHNNMQFNRAALNSRQGHHVKPEEDESYSSDSSDSGTDSPAPPTQPARKRLKSNHEQAGEAEYKPSSGGKRHVNSSALDGSSDEDEYGRPDSSTGRKRARKSTPTSASTPNSQAAHTPRPTSANSGKRSTRKRQSGTQIPRAPLSEEQRRKNHIRSEKNRRDLIKFNYTELNNLIPALKNGKSGLSKSEVLKEIVEFIEELVEGNADMEEVLKSLPTSFHSKYNDGYSSADDDDEGPGGTAGGLNGVEAY